ncbi:YbhB/YbcL family Raf kinase inhibitor-like protein [Hyphomicrobium sp.]|uniref:YbhB/YbcL family Raf kinase inhibitor-like protein n=1 Tax=Hyphomicrobium sp. TaxID=82 RepID=UPI0025C3DB8A|nr:YbhB/YbcL family Raf kinase inhibitor-like protein [Hyphomicrobium sp.]MCC7253683.1 YbhB/YbcL family Raf kinase inhibitor-like protein [Hyphomicrobium sp.]
MLAGALLAVGSLVCGASSGAENTLELKSPTFEEGAPISNDHFWNEFGCSGGNKLPDLEWSKGPEGTASYAITFYDHDAPTGSGFWHWVIYDIPADVTAIKGGQLPAGAVEGNTDLGKPGFFGPCPPKGRKHRYTFTVHALKAPKLEVDKSATAALTGFFIYQNTLAKGELSGFGGPRE